MPNPLHITCENPDEILNAGLYGTGALIRIQSSTTETGAFADLTGTGSTPTIAVLAATRSYTGYDPLGTSSTWYRTRYESADTLRLSDWSAAFQIGGEAAGLICSLYDVKQRISGTLTANADELLLDFIRDATTDLEGYCGRWFVPRPVSGATTYLFSPPADSRTLWIPKGVRSITALGYATTDQPDTGGIYTAIATTAYSLQPSAIDRDPGFPATRITLLDISGLLFYAGINRVQVTGAFGFAEPPADVAGIGVNMVIRRYQARGSGVATALGGEDFGGRILRWTSPEEREKLTWYRVRVV